MLQKPTVLVLGAGASADFHLPTGPGLQKAIAALVEFEFDYALTRGSPEIFEAACEVIGNKQAVFDAGRLISRGLETARSIDDYLYNHGNVAAVVEVGKMAIAAGVAAAEANSPLRVPHYSGDEIDPILNNLRDTWPAKFFSHLQTGVRTVDLDHLFDNLTIVNFNYDRCLEEYLYLAIQQAYSVDERRAAEVMTGLKMVRPYGQIGALPWQTKDMSKSQFGTRLRRAQLIKIGAAIRTFTEQSHDEQEKESWRAPIRAARQIAFLGFGFHKQNMDLLNVGFLSESVPQIYATVLGTSVPDREVFLERLETSIYVDRPRASAPHWFFEGCDRFMHDYGLRLVS